LTALQGFAGAPKDAGLAALYAMFDVLCGLSALPTILFGHVPERRDYVGDSVRGPVTGSAP
jgi:hypothetical protein